jgi:hypothetical protein
MPGIPREWSGGEGPGTDKEMIDCEPALVLEQLLVLAWWQLSVHGVIIPASSVVLEGV